jgi:hypothetical protein
MTWREPIHDEWSRRWSRARRELLEHAETRTRLDADGVTITEGPPSTELLSYLVDICHLAFLDHLLPNSEPDKRGVFFDDLLGILNRYKTELMEADKEEVRRQLRS